MTKPKKTTKKEQGEKPTYETPVIVDLNQVQRGEGQADCAPGSSAVACDSGSAVQINF